MANWLHISQLRDLATRLDGMLEHLSDQNDSRSVSTRSHDKDSCPQSVGATTEAIDRSTTDGCYTDALAINDSMTSSPIINGNWSDRLSLDRWLLNHFLQRYRAMQHYFPFVVIPDSWDVAYMLDSRPLLLLAVIASAACHYPQLQQRLVKDLRDALTRRVMVGGESTLELLQAMLVHLAW